MWKIENDKLVTVLTVNNFKEVLLLVNKIGVLAEEIQHHPDLRIFDYKKLEISLYTHSEKAITEKDRLLANRIDEIL